MKNSFVNLFLISIVIILLSQSLAFAESFASCPSWFTALDRFSTDTYTTESLIVKLDGCQVIGYSIDTVAQGTPTPVTINLEPDDIFIEWDEDPNNGNRGDFTFTGDLIELQNCEYVQVSATHQIINWTLYKALSNVTITVIETGFNEHDAIHVTRKFISSLTKDDGLAPDSCVKPGDPITYTICYENMGDPNGNGQDYIDAYIIDFLPPSVDYPAGSEQSGPSGPVYDPNTHSCRWDVGTIAFGDSNCLTLDVVVNNNATPGGTIQNIADIYFDQLLLARAVKDTFVCCQWEGIDPDIIYVDHTADGISNGRSWQNAYTDLQNALLNAQASQCTPQDGFNIYVAQGTYSPGQSANDTFALPDNVSVYGGFKNGGTPFAYRNPDKYITTLDGMVDPNGISQNNTVVTMGNKTLINGFTVKDSSVCGIYSIDSDIIIENCNIIDGLQNGIKAVNGNLSLKWCKIKLNGAYGIWHTGEGCELIIENSTISKNKWYGILTISSTPIIKNCVISWNGQSLDEYEGINILYPQYSPVLHNNTIAYNKKFGISFFDNADVSGDPNFLDYPDIQNCILWRNNDNQSQTKGCDPNLFFYNCIYDPNDPNGTDYAPDTNNNFSGDPGFAYYDLNQYNDPEIEFNPHLAYNSPCIDKASPYLVYIDQNDIDSENRIVGLCVDIGADEVYSCDGDLSADDIYNQLDYNADGMLNIEETIRWSRSWLTHDPCDPALYNPSYQGYYDYNNPSNPNYVDPNDQANWDNKCNLDDTGDSASTIDMNDLMLFSRDGYWLWTACWKQSQMNRFPSEPTESP